MEGTITLQPRATALTLRNCENVNAVVSKGLEVPSGTIVTVETVLPATVVFGLAPMAGHMLMSGPFTLSNTNAITIAATAFDDASVTFEGGVTAYMPNQLAPMLSGSNFVEFERRVLGPALRHVAIAVPMLVGL